MDRTDQLNQLVDFRQRIPLDLDPKETALLVIDMQCYQTKLEGALLGMIEGAFPGLLNHYINKIEKSVLPNIETLLGFFRDKGVKIIHFQFASKREDGSDLIPLLRQANMAAKAFGYSSPAIPPTADPMCNILSPLTPLKDEQLVIKTSSSPFSSTDINSQLHQQGIRNILVCGVVANMCVESTARDAADRGFNTVIIKDATAGFSPDIEEATFRSFGMNFGWVMSGEELKKRFED